MAACDHALHDALSCGINMVCVYSKCIPRLMRCKRVLNGSTEQYARKGCTRHSNTEFPLADGENGMRLANIHDWQVHDRSPALLTRMCRAPYFSIVALMILGAKSSAVTSPGILSASPPASRMLDATCTETRLSGAHQKSARRLSRATGMCL